MAKKKYVNHNKAALPSHIELPSGEIHQLVVARIACRDDYGRPITLDLVYEDTPAEVVHNDEFMLTYLPWWTIQKREENSQL